ncbi:MAG TPA: SEC-C metal-binding domain-containing protein [Fredinandcohnia sp.]|nr:SEC-C metal-binding domain-containing protein [Fredinandcohnia sp.]
MKLGRNDPCHCGSGRKFKNCHGRPGSKETSDRSVFGLLVVGLVLLVALVSAVVEFAQSDGLDAGRLVWSEEHGHWHTVDGREVPSGTPVPQPPGEPPPGKVWSPEHGHWHDAP